MLKPVFIACVVALGTFAIVIGCNAPSTDGDVANGSRRAAGDDDDDDAPKKKSSSGTPSNTPAADCTKLPEADPRPACDQCTRSKCCDTYAACSNSATCKQVVDCIAAAKDTISAYTCTLTDDGKLSDLADCTRDNCAAECPSTLSLDGGFGDPFGDDDDQG